MCIYTGFTLLLLMHALDKLIVSLTLFFFSDGKCQIFIFVSLAPGDIEVLGLFQAVQTPGTTKLVTMALCLAETIGAALLALNAPDHLWRLVTH